jgi:prepilin-type N-terminal cleavage/methylation domain-containing protein
MLVTISTTDGGPAREACPPFQRRLGARLRWARQGTGRLRAQGGFTLIEMMIAASLTLLVLGATLTVFESSQRIQIRDAEYALAMQEGRTGLQRIAREVRQAYKVESAGENELEFLIKFGSSSYKVYYKCNVEEAGTGYDKCVRLSAAVGSSLPSISSGATIVPRVLNQTSADPKDPIFKYEPSAISPEVVQLRAVLPAAGSLTKGQGLKHHVVLSDSAYIRNLDLS